jgi:Peptidase family M28
MRRLAGLVAAAGCTASAGPTRTSVPAAPPAAAPSTRPTRGGAVDPEVVAAMAEITAASAKRHVEKLAAFGTRHSASDASLPARGVGAARRWIKDELERSAAGSGRSGDAAMTVSFETHLLAPGGRLARETEIVDVVAVLPGAMPAARARRYYAVAHYDSRASDVMDATADAPGANDDASGVAVLLEAARVMAKRRYDATLVFLATAGEEQGLLGAKAHAKAAKDAGIDVRGVLNFDIVGDPTGPGGARHDTAIRVFSEGLPSAGADVAEVRKLSAESDSPSRELARFVADTAALYALEVRPALVFRPDRFLRGGDHLAFNEAGFAAVRFTTVDETYERQHQDVRVANGVRYGDLPEFVDGAFLANVARLDVAVLSELANAPSSPADARIVTAELDHGALVRWTRSPEPDVAGYEVVWRATTSPTWSDAHDAGDKAEARLAASKDDALFGVRAYDRQGRRSPVAFARAAAK